MNMFRLHCLKSDRIRSYSGPLFLQNDRCTVQLIETSFYIHLKIHFLLQFKILLINFILYFIIYFSNRKVFTAFHCFFQGLAIKRIILKVFQLRHKSPKKYFDFLSLNCFQLFGNNLEIATCKNY